MPTQRTIVIGAGIGGLVSAIDLARQGCDVLVLERAAAPGGKLREVVIDGRGSDAGPTVFTMRWVFDELFADAGTSLEQQLSLRPCETLARHAWKEDERLDLHADRARSAAAIARFAGQPEGDRYLDFCERAGAVYRTLEAPFIRGTRPTPLSLAARAGWRGLPDLLRISPFTTLWSSLAAQFQDPRLRQLFGRYATYCGSSPFAAPATLMLVAHVEQQGVWLVEGGMHRIAEVLAAEAMRLGATIRYGCDVREIGVHAGRAAGVRIGTGGNEELVEADAVVFNGDAAALHRGLLGPAAQRAVDATTANERSLSAVTWNILGTSSGFPLVRHNVFFGRDYADEFDAIFRRHVVPRDPTVYVCAQDRDDTGALAAPDGRERLLCLVNAPARGDIAPLDATEISQCRQRLTSVLARCGLRIEAEPEQIVTTTPSDFDRLYPGSGGALYGQASHGWAASFSRPGARSRIAGLYLAGGTVHPGPGVPMAALSGRQAAASLLADRASDRASTARFLPPATSGGISTR